MKFKSYIKQKWLLSIIAVTLMIVYYLNFIQLPPAVSVELQQNYKYKLFSSIYCTISGFVYFSHSL